MRRNWALFMMVTAWLATPATAEIRRMEHRVSADSSVELFVREVVDSGVKDDGFPVVLLDGARVPGLASFDLPVEGGSLAADLARTGHPVFIMDARGYGRSTRPEAMSGPQDGKPLVTSHEVVRDIDAVVEWVRKRTGKTQLAWSCPSR